MDAVGQYVYHAEQIWHILDMESSDPPPAKYALFKTWVDRYDSNPFELTPIHASDWPVAQAKLEAKGGTVAFRELCKGNYFWHPKCAKCPRCLQFKPECGYDLRHGRLNTICNRCADAEADVAAEKAKGV
jgi:hypothetical protein